MEGEQYCRQLPEHLVENIIARMPFPSIFKARTLSKAWLARFPSLESHEGDSKSTIRPRVAENFQNLVSERSHTWEISGPVCICYDYVECHAGKRACRSSTEKCYAYSGASETWQKIPSLSFTPWGALHWRRFTTEGALMFMPRDADFYYAGPRRRRHTEELYIANILTRNCKLLPPRPIFVAKEEVLLAKIVISTPLQTYKVVLFVQTFHFGPPGSFNVELLLWVQIFDSTSCSWRNKMLVGRPHQNNNNLIQNKWSLNSAVHFNGALYIVASMGTTRLAAFDMEEETWRALSIGDGENAIHRSHTDFISWLVVCDSDLFMVCSKGTATIGSDLYIRVLKVDLILETLSVVAEGPPRSFNLQSGHSCGEPVAYGGCIYLRVEMGSRVHSIGQMPVYNVRANSWSCISSCPDGLYTGCFFEPGLNPFIAV